MLHDDFIHNIMYLLTFSCTMFKVFFNNLLVVIIRYCPDNMYCNENTI